MSERDTLYKDWEKLKSIEEKLDFWTNKLPINYVVFSEENKEEYRVLDWFTFKVGQRDYKKLNHWYINKYLELSQDPDKQKKLLVFDDMISAFKKKYESADNKDEMVRKELMRIDFSFEDRGIKTRGAFSGFGKVYRSNWEFNANYESYITYLNYDVAPDYSQVPPFLFNVLQIENGYTLARYRKYIGTLRKEEDESGISEQEDKADRYNVRVQLQILYFLGVLQDLDKGTVQEKGVFFGALLNRHPQRARKPFSAKSLIYHDKAPEAKNIKRDLLKVKQLFEDFDLETSEIEKAIKKINTNHKL
ncbi:MAG TPA: hypothetical protein VEB63_10020 [Chitinophagaceae bacterium]|nr:hypothetical protein [Chitinophagaceae bacterium]